MHCAWCSTQMQYVHGHAACVTGGCPMYGLNQAECCSGDMACAATSDVVRAPAQQQSAPAQQQSAPAQQQSAPAQQQSAPAQPSGKAPCLE